MTTPPPLNKAHKFISYDDMYTLDPGNFYSRSQSVPLFAHTVGISLFLILIAAPGAPEVTWGLLLLWSLLGVREGLQALTLLMLTKLLNPAVYAFAETSTVYFYATLITACTRILLTSLVYNRIKYTGVLSLLAFGIYGAFNAVFFSYYFAVSLTKILFFTYSACAILIGFQICALRRVDWTPWFLGMWMAVVILSVPTLTVDYIGYARDGQGFQGILNHPQTFAVFLAPMVCWMLGQYLFVRGQLSVLWLAVIAVAITLMFMTLARTAVITVIFSLMLVFTFAVRYRGLMISALRKGPVLISLIISLSSLPFVGFENIIIDFVMKGSEAQGIGEAYDVSRGFLIARAWESFISHPFFGIGFGVSFEDYFSPIYDKLTGLPISAATEKSLLPVVLLEELGTVGLILFIPMLYQITRASMESKVPAIPLLILSCFLVNIGEAVLFSIAALGLYLWLLIGWALSTARPEHQMKNAQRRRLSLN